MSKLKENLLRYLFIVSMIVCIFTVSAFADEANPVSDLTNAGTDVV